jgi:hypothetical protein
MEPGLWQADDWQSLPATRILLDGDPGEAMLIQTDLALTDVATALERVAFNRFYILRL